MEFYKIAANDFARTRTTIWPGVSNFLSSVPTDSLILDAGCGNGKNMLKTGHKFIGLDTCSELLDITRKNIKCKSNIIDLVVGSVDNLPFEDNSFDAVMSIAVVHHLKTYEDRLKAFTELIRVCRPGGKILITVWQLESNPVYHNGTSDAIDCLNKGDRLIGWKLQFRGQKVDYLQRFYHFYSQEEIESVVSYCEKNYHVKGSIRTEKYNYYVEFDKFVLSNN